MPEATNNESRRDYTYHLDDCTACEGHDRAKAYRWLGENHWIPGLHGANWLGQDLIREIGQLELGQELEFDYRGETPNAPLLVVRRSAEGVVTASAPDGWRDTAGTKNWTWEPSEKPERAKEIALELLGYLQSQRGAHGVVLIPPQG